MTPVAKKQRKALDGENLCIEEAGAAQPTNKAPEAKHVLTFGINHSPVEIEILDTQTIYDLVDGFCQETSIGKGEGVYDHCWLFEYDGKTYESHVGGKEHKIPLAHLALKQGSQLKFGYDYGDTSYYGLTLKNIRPLSGEEDPTSFWRKKVIVASATIVPHVTDLVDLSSSVFNPWIASKTTKINLFQPGRRQVFAYIERDGYEQRHMIAMNAKAKSLTEYVRTLEAACRIEPQKEDGFIACTWHSIIIYPNSNSRKANNQVIDPGFIDHTTGPYCDDTSIDKAFPKVAAFAGFRKDRKVSKGWVVFQNGILTVCQGQPKGNGPNKCVPKDTTFVYKDRHEPEPEAIVHQQQFSCATLHDLFCQLEGVLGTLG